MTRSVARMPDSTAGLTLRRQTGEAGLTSRHGMPRIGTTEGPPWGVTRNPDGDASDVVVTRPGQPRTVRGGTGTVSENEQRAADTLTLTDVVWRGAFALALIIVALAALLAIQPA